MHPHAREQMRGISEAPVRGTLNRPAREYQGNLGRTVAERRVGEGRLD
jgi:hypothetical protein